MQDVPLSSPDDDLFAMPPNQQQRPPAANPYARQEMPNNPRTTAQYLYQVGNQTYAMWQDRAQNEEYLQKSRAGKWLVRYPRLRFFVLAAGLFAAVAALYLAGVVLPSLLVRFLYWARGIDPAVEALGVSRVGPDGLLITGVVEPGPEPMAYVSQLVHAKRQLDGPGLEITGAAVKSGYVEWIPFGADSSRNATLAGIRRTLAAHTTGGQHTCGTAFSFGVPSCIVYVPGASGLVHQSEEGAMVELGHKTLEADECDSDDGVILYEPRIVSEDPSITREVQHECELHALMRAAARDGPPYVTPADRAAEGDGWAPYNVSGLVEFIAHNGLVRRRRVYMPLFACIKHYVALGGVCRQNE